MIIKKKPVISIAYAIVLAGLFLFLPRAAGADAPITGFIFITEPQDVATGAVSGELKIQAQDALGNPVSAGKTLCLGLYSVSKTGEFSSNSGDWKPVNTLTINSNWTARAFYYRDTVVGTHRIDASVAIKPEGTTCAVWPIAEWDIQWSASQNIIVGSGGSSAVSLPSSSPSSSLAATSTPSGISSSYHMSVTPLPPAPTIQAFAGEDRVALAGVEENFIGGAVGLVREPITNARFWWNFGDGQTLEGRSVGHTYRGPGVYTAVLSVSSGEYAASDYAIVRVIPNKIAIAQVISGEDGAIRIVNPSLVGADIGGWMLEDDRGRKFFLPVHTVIGAESEVAFANRVTGLSPNTKVILHYPGGFPATGWDAGAKQGSAKPTGATSSAGGSSRSPIAPGETGVVVSRAQNTRRSVAHQEAAATTSLMANAFSAVPTGEAVSVIASKRTVHFPGAFFTAAFALSAFAAAGFFLVRHLSP